MLTPTTPRRRRAAHACFPVALIAASAIGLLMPEPAPSATAGDLSGAALPHHAHLVYDTTGSVRLGSFSLPALLHGVTQTDWRFAGGRFESSLVNELAEFRQGSSGVLRAGVGLAPERYTEKRHHKPEIWTGFNWDSRRVSFSQSPAVLDAPDGIQDRLSVQFQMALLRQAFPERFAPGAHFPIVVAGTHDYAEWRVTVCCDEAVTTPNGPLPATRIQSNRVDGSSKEAIDLWLSPKLGWFPARVRLIDRDGDVIDSVLQSATLE